MAQFLTVTIDSEVEEYLRNYAEGIEAAIRFGCEQARVALRTEGYLGAAVERIGTVQGFPLSYLHQLILAVYRLPLVVTTVGGGVVQATLSLGPLGNESDLDKGRHDQAMLASNDDGAFKSFRISTKSAIQKVQLPYGGEALLNEESRIDWWNDKIVARNTPYTMVGRNWGWTKPATRTQEENAWIAEDVPTYEQVASRRATLWASMGVAPQWLLLEYGTAAYYGSSDPAIEPQNFEERIERLMRCVCRESIDASLASFKKLLDQRGVVGVKGPQNRPYDASGEFVKYKDLIGSSRPNLSSCLGLI